MQFRKNILPLKPYVPGKPIEEVKRELGLKKVTKLASNENPYGPSPKVREAVARAVKTLNRYPDGGCYQLRRFLGKRFHVGLNQIIFGNGSDEIIGMALRALVEPGDEVIVAKPSFLMYSISAQVAGANVKEIPLRDFRYDLNEMRMAVTPKTKIIFIGNPDNPTGTYVLKTEAEKFLKEIPSDVLIFFDEAYFEFVTAPDYPDSLSLLRQHKNMIVTRTFSKLYGLAGLRIGYGLADVQVIDFLNRVREPFNVNSLAQAAAMACLKDQHYYQRIVDILVKQRQYLYQQLSRLKISFVKTETNFILIDVKRDGHKVFGQLLKRGVIVRDMGAWGLKNFIRVTIGTQEENLKFIEALRQILGN